MRTPSEPTALAPFIGQWTAASLALGIRGAANSPFELPSGMAEDAEAVRIYTGVNDAAALVPQFHLLYIDIQGVQWSVANAPGGKVLAVIAGPAAEPATTKYSTTDNTAATRLLVPLEFDIRGLDVGGTRRLYLALAATGGANPVTLFHWAAIRRRPL